MLGQMRRLKIKYSPIKIKMKMLTKKTSVLGELTSIFSITERHKPKFNTISKYKLVIIISFTEESLKVCFV
jgi:hypothetical protein